MHIYLMIIIGVAILVLLIAAIIVHRKHQIPHNYRAFFIIGVTWLPLGIIMKNYVFSLVGACFLAIGLANRKKWNEEKKWADLPPEVRRLKLIVIIVLGVLLLAGMVMYYFANQGFIKY
jgi:hypothetical protein